jgi:limonene-1,2-epoxide hydrolase
MSAIERLDESFGSEARNRLAEIGSPTADGALAALETFYFALNGRDLEALTAVWSQDPLAQLNNPLGGIIRGGSEIAALYARIFASPVHLTVLFDDIVRHAGDAHAIFAGREHANVDDGALRLEIRTTRYFAYANGRWAQVHHHGSIDDPGSLVAYRRLVA